MYKENNQINKVEICKIMSIAYFDFCSILDNHIKTNSVAIVTGKNTRYGV